MSAATTFRAGGSTWFVNVQPCWSAANDALMAWDHKASSRAQWLAALDRVITCSLRPSDARKWRAARMIADGSGVITLSEMQAAYLKIRAVVSA